MGDALFDLLAPHFDGTATPPPKANDAVTTKYLSRLCTLSLSALTTSEPESLDQSTNSNLRSFQSLSARSNAAIVASSDHLRQFSSSLPQLHIQATALRTEIPSLDEEAVHFSEKYSRLQRSIAEDATNTNTNNDTQDTQHVLQQRKRAQLLARNVDRISDILDLPMLLTSAISSASSTVNASSQNAGPSSSSASAGNFASALDLHSYIKRLHLLYPDSALVQGIYKQTEEAMQEMTFSLIQSLRASNVKLAGAMRTVGWLRRIAPELDSSTGSGTILPGQAVNFASLHSNKEGVLGALFLVCRLSTLLNTLNALEPLRDLADQETASRNTNGAGSKRHLKDANTSSKRDPSSAWSSGQQSERYLKRYIEIFREQSFAIISMYRSIFPSTASTTSEDSSRPANRTNDDDLTNRLRSFNRKGSSAPSTTPPSLSSDPLLPLPAALSTFPTYLVGILTDTLRAYLPNVRDRSSRESLLTQVLYCAGSLGRLGGDFSILLSSLSDLDADEDEDERGKEKREGEEDDDEEEYGEWIAVMKKHRVLSVRLEKMAGGAGVASPTA